MEKYTNEFGKVCFKGVRLDDKFNVNMFHEIDHKFEDDVQFAMHTNLGSFTVLDRMTGYGFGVRDTETGYRDTDKKFWLASGMQDVRLSESETFRDAIDWIKSRSNTCVGV